MPEMGDLPSILVTVTGQDRPGIASRLFSGLAPLGLPLLDVAQVQVHGRLLLCVEVGGAATLVPPVREALEKAFAPWLGSHRHDLTLTVAELEAAADPLQGRHPTLQLVSVLAPDLDGAAMAEICERIAACGGNIDRIVRLSTYPVTSYELTVSGAVSQQLRRELSAEAVRLEVDVAVQPAGLHRRAKHLIVLDADSTLLQGEVIDLLAERAGCASQVAAVTAAAMAGKLDFTQSLIKRLELLAGTPAEALDSVAEELTLTPGARTLVRTLKRLGYVTSVVSGGFVQVIAPIAAELGIDHLAANTLEVADGKLTGRLIGPVIDRAGKAEALVRFAEEAGVPLARTIAVGDGANDLDMLALAGLGIAFNAKPVVRDAADTALTVPYLDAILFLLGIARQEIEAADAE